MLDRFSIAPARDRLDTAHHLVLVAGIGNVFFGDDGFGVEVVRKLACETLPDRVRVTELGLDAERLGDELGDGYGTVILVDSFARGDAPGTIFVAESELAKTSVTERARVRRVLIIGCEPGEIVPRMGLSEPVRCAVNEAVRVVHAIVDQCAD
jgi:hydrogenase maturation protease